MLAPVFRFVIAVFLFSTAVFSQQIQTIPREQAESPELQKLRPIWLEKLSKDVANLKLPENRATVDARLGDLYWKTDQNRARMLFNQAIDELIKAQQETKPLMDAGNLNTVYAFYNIRLQILRLIVRNDENLGFDLFIKSRPQIVSDALAGRPLPSGAIPGDMPLNVSYVSPPPNPTLGQTLIRQESEVEQSLASAVLASNPKRIADVLSRITPENLSNSTYYTLRNLSSKDPLAASTAANEIIRKILAAEIPRDANAISFINQALAYSLPENSPQNKLQIDKGLIHQLAEKEADFLILNADNPNSVVSYLISGKSTLLKLLPERAAELNEKVIYNINPPVLPLGINTPDKEAQALLATGTPEKILSEAEKYQPPLRDTFYTIAAAKIASAGDMNRAKGILSEHFSGERLASLYANLNARLAATATAKGEYDKAFEYIEQTNSPGRYITLISLATTIQTKANDNQKARTILARARQLISPTINTREDFEKWARMASAYALIDPATGFQMFETLVRKGDMILSASVVADAFQTSLPSIRNNEYMINNYTFIRLPVSNIVMNNFVKADPARTLKILNRIKRPELRLNLELQVFENNFRLTGGGIGIGIGSGVSTGIYSIEQ